MKKFRDYNAEYYDAGENYAADIPFYIQETLKTDEILEVGCGTGRVSFPLAKKALSLWGIDISDNMLTRASSKITNRNANLKFSKADMFNLNLNKNFDLIIAPFRVVQCCESEEQQQSLFKSIKEHLKPNGRCILNAFNPYLSKEDMGSKWLHDADEFDSKIILENGDLLVVFEERQKISTEKQILYTDLISKRYREDKLIDTYINSIYMKYFYPDEFLSVIQKYGFEIIEKWGGYKSETYGQGNELVVSFKIS